MLTNKRWAIPLTLAVVAALVLSACAPPTPEKIVETVVVTKEVPVEVTKIVEVTKEVVVTPTPVKFRRGGTVVIGMATSDIVILDPAAYSDRPTETVIRNMFDGLVTRTRENEVVLELAESAEWIDDKTIEFKLKKGVKFHNGEDLTADDVVFTFERILFQDIGAKRRGFCGPMEKVEKVDDYTVRFHFKEPWPVFWQMLVHNQIVPKDYLEEVGDEEFAKHPVGAGPFKFVEGKLDEYIVMERFEDYYGGADDLPPVGPAFLDRVIFKMIPEASTRVAALLAGEVDIIQSVPAYMVPKLLADPNVEVKMCGGTRPKFMDMNVKMPPFDDVRVRKAINYAVDAEEILAKVAGGYGVILPGPLSPFNLYADPTLQPYGYDPDKALALLGEAGWKDTDGDGILDKEGKPFSMVIDAYGPYVEIAEAVAGQLREVGIDASVRVWEWGVLKKAALAGERMAVMRDWGDSAFDPVGYIEAKWHTRVEGTPLGRGNFSQYSNPRVDELIEAGATEPDPDKRREIYNEMQRLIWEDAPALFLYVPQEIEACRIRVQNWAPSPDSRENMHDVWVLE